MNVGVLDGDVQDAIHVNVGSGSESGSGKGTSNSQSDQGLFHIRTPIKLMKLLPCCGGPVSLASALLVLEEGAQKKPLAREVAVNSEQFLIGGTIPESPFKQFNKIAVAGVQQDNFKFFEKVPGVSCTMQQDQHRDVEHFSR
jgi:hypothetical protein